jgi:hypothetical protein
MEFVPRVQTPLTFLDILIYMSQKNHRITVNHSISPCVTHYENHEKEKNSEKNNTTDRPYGPDVNASGDGGG